MTKPGREQTLRILLVNLPHHERVQRRWVASYYAPNFLIPPVELMGLAALIRSEGVGEVELVDAIAEGLSVNDLARRYRSFSPDLVVGLAGFRILNEDLSELAGLTHLLPGAKSAIFGYLPTHAPELIAAAGIDFVLRAEPEETLVELCRALRDGGDLEAVAGLAFMRDGSVILTDARARLRDLDHLPPPDHTLVDLSRYNESFVPRPIGVVTSSRGCPYPCSFCVRAYGRELALRSWESLAAEIDGLVRLGIRNVRFLDDTFTVQRERVVELSRWLATTHPNVRWTCLTRLDRVDAELARIMARGGCRRMYVGIESADAERRTEWNKNLSDEAIRGGVAAARAVGIEVSGFFIVGAPGETDAEVIASADFAAELGLDWVIATRLQYWPGTKLFAGTDGRIEFTLGDGEPGTGPDHEARLYARERLFYRRFYVRPRWLAGRVSPALRSPADSVRGALQLGRYLAGAVPTRDFI